MASSAVGRRWVGCGEELGGHGVMHGVVGAWAVLRALQSGGSMSLGTAWNRAAGLPWLDLGPTKQFPATLTSTS